MLIWGPSTRLVVAIELIHGGGVALLLDGGSESGSVVLLGLLVEESVQGSTAESSNAWCLLQLLSLSGSGDP